MKGGGMIMSFLDVLTCGLGGAILLFLTFSVVRGNDFDPPLRVNNPVWIDVAYGPKNPNSTATRVTAVRLLLFPADQGVESDPKEIKRWMNSPETMDWAGFCDISRLGLLEPKAVQPTQIPPAYVFGMPIGAYGNSCDALLAARSQEAKDTTSFRSVAYTTTFNGCDTGGGAGSCGKITVLLPQADQTRDWYLALWFDVAGGANSGLLSAQITSAASDDSMVVFVTSRPEDPRTLNTPIDVRALDRLIAGPF